MSSDTELRIVVVPNPDEEPAPLAAQEFKLTLVDKSLVWLLLTPTNTDWWEHYKRGWSDPFAGPPMYTMGGVSVPLEITYPEEVEQPQEEVVESSP